VLASVTFTSVVVAVHVMAVVIAFGVLFAYPVLLRTSALPALHEGLIRLHRMVVTPAMVVVLLAGIYLASDLDVWDQSWVSIPLLLLLILFGLLHGAIVPAHRRLAAAAPGPDYDAQLSRLNSLAMVAAALVLVAIFFMVVKP
jgi:uncharacterized membrane protein